jgi:hypothetical protein
MSQPGPGNHTTFSQFKSGDTVFATALGFWIDTDTAEISDAIYD